MEIERKGRGRKAVKSILGRLWKQKDEVEEQVAGESEMNERKSDEREAEGKREDREILKVCFEREKRKVGKSLN